MELRSSLGLCHVYHRLAQSLTELAIPLNPLLKNGKPPKLEPIGSATVPTITSLINAVTSPSIFVLPNLSLPYDVDTDASDKQAVLAVIRVSEDDKQSIIGYFSLTLNLHERNYSGSEE